MGTGAYPSGHWARGTPWTGLVQKVEVMHLVCQLNSTG